MYICSDLLAFLITVENEVLPKYLYVQQKFYAKYKKGVKIRVAYEKINESSYIYA